MIDFNMIPLFKNIISIEEMILDTRSKYKFKIVTEEETYFVKIEDITYSERKIKKIKWLYTTYENLGISVVSLIDIMTIGNETLWVFNFLDGDSLDKANLEEKELYEYGVNVGKDILKLNKVPFDDKLFIKTDMMDHERQREEIILNRIRNKDRCLEIYSLEEWDEILTRFKKLAWDIKDDEIMINHNDIKLANILIDKDKKYYFIDIDPFDATILGYNVGYSISEFFLGKKNKNKQAFLRGFIKTIDKDRKLIKQLNYFIIADLINKIDRLYDDIKENKNYIKELIFDVDKSIERSIYEEE